MSRKDLFRDFLKKNNFLTPKSQSFYNLEDAKEWINELDFPIIVKPVDSSGSKGVSKIESEQNYLDIEKAFGHALNFSRGK